MAFIDTHPEESLFRLLGELKDDLTELIRKEIALAKSELAAKAKGLGKGAAMFGVAAVLAIFAAFYICLCLDHALLAAFTAMNMPLGIAIWFAPFVLGGLLAIGGLILALTGLKSMRRANPKPQAWRTVQSLRAMRAHTHRAESRRKG